jgi:hypothetical protein
MICPPDGLEHLVEIKVLAGLRLAVTRPQHEGLGSHPEHSHGPMPEREGLLCEV